MISRLRGTLLRGEGEVVEVATRGGVVYEVEVPLTVLQRLPADGTEVEILTAQVVSESSAALYGFLTDHERALFRRVRSVSGVGAKTALAALSSFTAERLARALAEKDVTALRQISGVGKKTAERMALELADKVGDLVVAPAAAGGEGSRIAQDAVQALVALGYSFTDADAAVRKALEDGADGSADALLRQALANR